MGGGVVKGAFACEPWCGNDAANVGVLDKVVAIAGKASVEESSNRHWNIVQQGDARHLRTSKLHKNEITDEMGDAGK